MSTAPAAKEKRTGRRDGTSRDRIIQAAARLFRAHGYVSISLRDIASSCGLTTGSVYHHFASKDDAVRAVLDAAHRLVLDTVRSAVESLPDDAMPVEKLRVAVEAHVTTLLGENSLPAATMRIFSHVPNDVRLAALPLRHEYENYWHDLLWDAQRSGIISGGFNPDVLTGLLFGAMNWLLEWYQPGRYGLDAICAQILRMIISDEGVRLSQS